MEIQGTFEDDDDDGVIFQGSPLYDSLVNSGSCVEDLNVEVIGSSDYPTFAEENRDKDEGVETSHTRSFGMFQLYWKWLLKTMSHLDLIEIYEIDRQTNCDIVQTLLECATLEDDDADFLQQYLDISHPVKSSTTKTVFVKNPMLFLFLVTTVCSYGFYRFSDSGSMWKYVLLTDVLAVIAAVYVITKGVVFAMKERHRRKKHADVYSLTLFLKKGELFLSILKKSLRLIQETELIARGFTFVSQKNPLSRLEQGGDCGKLTRQCPALRKLLFCTARDSIHYLRQSTQTLFTINPLGPEMDVQSSYLAFEPIQSYGPCLHVDDMDESADVELYNLTDGFSVSALKEICHLLSLHQSEFIKGLVLIYYHGNTRTEMVSFDTTLRLVDEISGKLNAWTGSVQLSYNVNNCSLVSREPVKRKVKVHSEFEDVNIAVHSLDLHLQAALTRVRSLNDWLEKQAENKQSTDWSSVSHDVINSMMQPIKAELDSCKGCWEEGLTRIDRIWGNSSQEGDSKADEGIQKQDDDSSEIIKSPTSALEDYIIEDQVFEAYTDPNEINLDNNDWEKPLTPQEKEKKQREKQEALRMLSELKSVISVRAVETVKREQAAWLRTHPELQLTANQNTEQESHDQHEGADIANSTTQEKSYDLINANESIYDMDSEEKQNKNKHSYVAYEGVRRLRKSNMLDVSDSDSDSEARLDKNNGDLFECESEDEPEVTGFQKLGLPTVSLESQPATEQVESDNQEISRPEIRMLHGATLEERLGRLSRGNLELSANIASLAVAKSHQMAKLEETTFGGEVFGECSDSDSDNNES